MNGKKSFGEQRRRRRPRPRGQRAGAAGKDGQRRPMFRRRKVCKFCSDKIDDINYKDVKLLMPFVPERAKILPRRISGTCAHAPAQAAHRDHARASAGADPVHRGVGGLGAEARGASARTETATVDDEVRWKSFSERHVDNLGKRGEIVKVADGYARNYLLPRKLALPATEGNKKHVERERKIVEAREAEEKGQAEAHRRAAWRASTSPSRAASATPSSSTAR